MNEEDNRLNEINIEDSIAKEILKPCPFCGSRKAGIRFRNEGSLRAVFIRCRTCSGDGPRTVISPERAKDPREMTMTVLEAIKWWNKREEAKECE